tara:strand:+ start:990 stop:1709 length:720 start_codon:yes stop_codon:yes gene_type:complete
MKIFPAIDLKDKKCVRLTRGEFSSAKIYNHDPILQAEIFFKNGLRFLHIVDLDGAKEGRLVNFKIVKEIVKKFNFKVEIGGGIRDQDTISKLIDIGVDKVILGTAAIKNINFLELSCKNYPNNIALAIDVRENKISISGWEHQTDINVTEYLDKVKNYGISRIIFTDIEKDGTGAGPNYKDSYNIAKRYDIPLLISGGINSIKDIEKIIKENNKIEGVVVGKSIYENKIKLEELKKLNG